MGGQAEWCGKWKYIWVHVFICPSSLYLLVSAFSPFTFKVIIDMCDPVTIFLLFWGLFSVGFFLLLCFLPREVPLAFVVKLAVVRWVLSTFACLESFWFLHQVWRRALLGCRFFPFITLNMSCHSLLACRVSVEKSANHLMGVPVYVICHFSFVAFHIFISNFCQLDYCVSRGVPTWVYPLWVSLCFLTWFTVSFSMLGKSHVRFCDPMDCSLPGSSVYGILQARTVEWVAISFSRVSSLPRNWTQVSCMAGRFFTNWATR